MNMGENINVEIRDHSVLPGMKVLEVWDGHEFVATVVFHREDGVVVAVVTSEHLKGFQHKIELGRRIDG